MHTNPLDWRLDQLQTIAKQHGIGRAFYCTVVGRQFVIIHSLIKKTQETPPADLKLARKRVKEVHREN